MRYQAERNLPNIKSEGCYTLCIVFLIVKLISCLANSAGIVKGGECETRKGGGRGMNLGHQLF